jgi:hypothetical protein
VWWRCGLVVWAVVWNIGDCSTTTNVIAPKMLPYKSNKALFYDPACWADKMHGVPYDANGILIHASKFETTDEVFNIFV